jgi:histidine triad (HIT) family protein
MADCPFCDIAAGKVPADIVYQDSDVVAFRDINPAAPVHVLVIPRKHFATYGAATQEDEVLFGKIARAAARVAAQEGLEESGYRCVINAGPHAQQSVPHLHVHVLGGRQMSWPPG